MNRKAMAEEQFRWIFILVAGALILGFFTSIVIKQKQAQEDAISAAELQNMEFLMANAKVATGSANEIELAQDINFDCNSIRIGRLSKQTKEPIFAPELLKGRNLVTWSLDWNMPYRATNLLFLTTDEARYVFVYDEDKYASSSSYQKFVDELYSKFPDKMNKEKVSNKESISDKNNYKTRIVLLDASIALPTFKGVSSMTIKGTDLEKGEIQFGGQSYYYIGLPALYAAIFSEDKENYECAMDKAFKKLKLASSVYSGKIEELGSIQVYECQTHYTDSNVAISTILGADVATLKNDNWATGLFGAISAMKNYNNELIKLSCPPIY